MYSDLMHFLKKHCLVKQMQSHLDGKYKDQMELRNEINHEWVRDNTSACQNLHYELVNQNQNDNNNRRYLRFKVE